jgi:catechol 2,3-dioxygenase-like lactoylglutathione lyase family enzyme
MSIGALDHVNIRTRRFTETLHFYASILGFEDGPRPNFRLPGAWLYSEGRVVLHLVDIRGIDEPQKSPGTGAIDHVAFTGRDFPKMKQRLTDTGVAFETREDPDRTIWQIFVYDPNGIMIELNYDMANHDR